MHDQPPRMPESPRRDLAGLLIPAAIFVVTFVAFLPALDNELVDIDDYTVLVETTGYRGLSWENIAWMFTTTTNGHWQPLTWLSYAVDYRMAGDVLDPSAVHRTNMLLHAGNAVLLYLVAIRLLVASGLGGGRTVRLCAAAAVLMWSVHPLRVESVAWATERRDVLSTCFLLGAMLAYLRAADGPGSSRWRWYAASIGLLALSLLAKAWGMSFFAIAIIADWFPLRRLPASPLRWFASGRVLAEKVPFVALGLGAAYAASLAIPSIGASVTLAEWPVSSRLVQAAYGLVWYPARTVWPGASSVLYELPRGLDPMAPRYVVCYAALAAAAIGLMVVGRRRPGVVAACGAYAVLILPVLGLAQAGDQFVAERYAYLSTMPLFVLAAAGLAGLCGRWRGAERGVLPAAAVVIVVLGVATWRQTEVWHDSVTLWRHSAEGGQDRIMARLAYGGALERAGDLDGAIAQYREAAARKPDQGWAWFSLGKALRQKGDLPGAADAYRRAADHMIQGFMPLVNLGSVLGAMGRPDEALEAYRAAVRDLEAARPGAHPSGVPYLALGAALAQGGDTDGARRAFQRALAFPACQEEARAQLSRLGP